MANEIFIKGTKEYYKVNLIDRLSTVDDLSIDASGWKYDIYDSGATLLVNQSDAAPQVMTLLCMVDTVAVVTLVVATNYHLYVYVNVGSERPKIGPFLFDIVAGT